VVAYTVSASPEDAGHTLTVAVDGPAVVSDAQGANTGQQQQQVTLDAQSAATFWVLLTGAGQADIHVALPYQLAAGTVYSQIDDSHPTQRLVMAESLDLVEQASAQLSGAAGAPAPPTPTEQATAPAAPPPTNIPPRATHRPSKPTVTEQPVATVIVGEQATAAPSPPPSENVTALPAATPETIAAALPAAPAGATAPQPQSLPNTGGHASSTWLALTIAGLLLTVGWAVRRRGDIAKVRK
jgi:LPXTG-motif cell wall-anchored protein